HRRPWVQFPSFAPRYEPCFTGFLLFVGFTRATLGACSIVKFLVSLVTLFEASSKQVTFQNFVPPLAKVTLLFVIALFVTVELLTTTLFTVILQSKVESMLSVALKLRFKLKLKKFLDESIFSFFN
ncbi:MAG: hypothetical protein RLZZ69_1141, partial [Cyanobacteriota bacterium]